MIVAIHAHAIVGSDDAHRRAARAQHVAKAQHYLEGKAGAAEGHVVDRGKAGTPPARCEHALHLSGQAQAPATERTRQRPCLARRTFTADRRAQSHVDDLQHRIGKHP